MLTQESGTGFVIQFSFLAAFFWLNVMCIDITWTFSHVQEWRARRSAVARLRTSDLTVSPNQVVCERADLLFEYRVIVMTLNLANELINLMKWNR
uniref:Uncharacterized protein n=1 Tax=Timema poppense TaxID=170557 RepID=A0A7R9CZ13_TIMPO|nr:unnamed protein product [Timema poppensis]